MRFRAVCTPPMAIASSVVNAGIGGNQVIGPAEYSPQKPFSGGPSAQQRLERDVLSLSGVSAVIWLEGINDFGRATNATVEAVQAGMKDVVGRSVRAYPGRSRHRRHSGFGARRHRLARVDRGRRKRKALNEFIRTSGVFDGVADFDKATRRSADRQPARRSSFRTAPSVGRATSSTRIARAIWPWRRRSI